MVRILGLSGSLRRNSFNAGLLRAAAAAAPAGARIDIGSIAQVPLYNADVEAAGTPPAVTALRDALAAADGFLMVTPEYNNGIPGVFKNTLDWMASGPSADLFIDKPVAVIGASAMRTGTILAQDAWLPVLRTLKARAWFGGRLMVGSARSLFDEAGNLHDEETERRLADFVRGFAEFCTKR